MGDYVPTTREIESGAVQVAEVQAVKDTDSIETANLQPLENHEEQLQFVVDNFATRNWADRFDVLHISRKLVKFSPESLEPHLVAVGKCLVESMKNPRSSVIRESLQLATDLFGCVGLKDPIKAQFMWAKLAPAILLKAINDKKFLAAEGQSALMAFTKDWAEHYRIFLAECDSRNPKIASVALRTIVECLQHLGDDLKNVEPVGPEAAPLQPLVSCSVKAMLKGKLADMREHGKVCLERVIAASGGWSSFESIYGAKIASSDMKQVALQLKPAEEAAPSSPHGDVGVGKEDGDGDGDAVQTEAESTVPKPWKPLTSTPRSRRSSDAEVMSEF
jgi:hypothetical protein